MQAVAVILALAVLAGCDARAVPLAPEDWQVGINNFFEKIVEISQQTSDMVQNIQTSQFRRELDTVISNSMADLQRYKEDVQASIRPVTETFPEQMRNDLQLLVDRLHRDLQEGKEQGINYLTEMKAMVGLNTDDMKVRMDSYIKKLKRRLNLHAAEIRSTVATYLAELQSRASQNIDSARADVEPFLQGTMQRSSVKMEEASSMLRSQAEELGQQLESQAAVLKTQLEVTGKEMQDFLEGMVGSLNEQLPIIASQVREKLEDIVEKVKEAASA